MLPSTPIPADSSAVPWPLSQPLPRGISVQLNRAGDAFDLPRNRSNAKQKRQREFAAGRSCAHRLLTDAGCCESVGVNDDRSPDWPSGFVGSISHSSNWTCAAIAPSSEIQSMGMDTEPVVSPTTREQLVIEIATQDEWSVVQSQDFTSEQIFSLVFSAKEAFYKCWYPLTGNFLEFSDAVVDAITPNCIRIRHSESSPNRIGQSRRSSKNRLLPQSQDVQFFFEGNDVFTLTWIEQGA